MMNICILGKDGMLGSALAQQAAEEHFNTIKFSHKDLDITDFKQFNKLDSFDIDFMINCSAITDTVFCNTNEGMIQSYAVNVQGASNIAKYCKSRKIHLVHISTDYVKSEFSEEEFPVNVYGCHKLLAEKFIQQELDIRDYSILRCSWLYGKAAKKNFVNKVHDFCKNTKDGSIKTVDDCFGRPSHVKFISEFILQCIKQNQYGIIDCQPNAKQISRCEFAKMIVKLSKLDINVVPIKSSEIDYKINQPKRLPERYEDQSNSLQKIWSSVLHSDEYEYWLNLYLKELHM